MQPQGSEPVPETGSPARELGQHLLLHTGDGRGGPCAGIHQDDRARHREDLQIHLAVASIDEAVGKPPVQEGCLLGTAEITDSIAAGG